MLRHSRPTTAKTCKAPPEALVEVAPCIIGELDNQPADGPRPPFQPAAPRPYNTRLACDGESWVCAELTARARERIRHLAHLARSSKA